jgi:hypothetical protein
VHALREFCYHPVSAFCDNRALFTCKGLDGMMAMDVTVLDCGIHRQFGFSERWSGRELGINPGKLV